MKRVEVHEYGVPERAVRCVEVADVGPPGPGEVVFDVLAFPINPADVYFCTGKYWLRPEPPAPMGAECVGRVAAVGDGVSHVAAGDLVINLQRENWAQRRRVRGEDVIAIPAGLPVHQAAMLKINPATARFLLSDVVELRPGDWVIQNAANSAVGRLVIRLARARGLRTVNVVRREALFADLAALGADACVLDGPDLARRVAALVGGRRVALGIDAVSGAATGRIAAALADGGTVANYGAMVDEDCRLAFADVLYRDVRLCGFALGRSLARRDLAGVRAVYAELGALMLAGAIDSPVEAVYPIEAIADAMAHAQREARGGKILVAPNGDI